MIAVFLLYAAALFGVAAGIAFLAEKLEGNEQAVTDFRRIMGAEEESVMDDPEWQRADMERWDRAKQLEEGEA